MLGWGAGKGRRWLSMLAETSSKFLKLKGDIIRLLLAKVHLKRTRHKKWFLKEKKKSPLLFLALTLCRYRRAICCL